MAAETKRRWGARFLVIAGTVAMLAGAVDPLEGAVLILPGATLVTLGTFLRKGDRRLALYWTLILCLIAAGVGAMFALSALGGIGGKNGRSLWWGLLVLPYPIGWVMGLVNLCFQVVRHLRFRRSAAPPAL